MNILNNWKKWTLLILAMAIAAGGLAFFREGKTPAQYRTAKVEQGKILAAVSSTGKVNAVVTVQVGSQVSGTIQQLFANFNSRVKKGQVVAQIDPALFQAQVDQAKGKLGNDEANEEKALVALADAKRNLGRMEQLLAQKLIAQSDKDTAQTAYDSAIANLKAAETQTAQDRAVLKLAVTNLQYTTILSPVDGTVISRNVDVGQTVAASFQAPTLFTIAQDLTEMQVDTNVDEADIGQVHEGQEAEFTVDAYPDAPFRGVVHDIYNQPVTVQNVVTYDAIIRVKNPEMKLKPGMNANVTIRVGERENVLKISNAALRYHSDTPIPQPSKTEERAHVANVWILKDQKEVPVRIGLGLSDGTFSEVVSGDLHAGDEAIIEKIKTAGSSGGRPPYMRF